MKPVNDLMDKIQNLRKQRALLLSGLVVLFGMLGCEHGQKTKASVELSVVRKEVVYLKAQIEKKDMHYLKLVDAIRRR